MRDTGQRDFIHQRLNIGGNPDGMHTQRFRQ
jgi:hypothetical protein